MIKLKFGLPIILRFTDNNAVIVRIPASKLGILQTVIKNPVTSPANIPATIEINVAIMGLIPLCIQITHTAAPNGYAPSVVISAIFNTLKLINNPIDNTIASAMATVVKVTDAKKIPVFPSADTMVADGGVLGLGVDQYQIGVETAKVVAKVLKGADTKDMPIVLANEGVIYLNEAKAKQLGIEIPKEIKEKAKVVDKK